jgi:hypothetical protein
MLICYTAHLPQESEEVKPGFANHEMRVSEFNGAQLLREPSPPIAFAIQLAA